MSGSASGGVEPRECEWPDCNMCWEAEKQRQAELGLRCVDCLEEFGRRPWVHPSEQDASRCPGCQAKAEWRATAPASPGRYGAGRNA